MLFEKYIFWQSHQIMKQNKYVKNISISITLLHIFDYKQNICLLFKVCILNNYNVSIVVNNSWHIPPQPACWPIRKLSDDFLQITYLLNTSQYTAVKSIDCSVKKCHLRALRCYVMLHFSAKVILIFYACILCKVYVTM